MPWYQILWEENRIKSRKKREGEGGGVGSKKEQYGAGLALDSLEMIYMQGDGEQYWPLNGSMHSRERFCMQYDMVVIFSHFCGVSIERFFNR